MCCANRYSINLKYLSVSVSIYLSLSVTLSLCRQYCVPGDDGGGVLLGGHVGQGGPQTVSAHLHVCERLLRLPVLLRSGLRHLPALPHDRRLWVSLSDWGYNGKQHQCVICLK